MVSLQTLCKVINTKDYGIIEKNALDKTFFTPYEKEFEFIRNHYETFGNVPDAQTFIEAFPDFQLFEVTETDEYLIRRLKEEHLYSIALGIVERGADIMRGNSYDAVNYLQSALDGINGEIGIKTVDIIHDASSRLEDYEKRLNGEQQDFYIPSGFPEMDNRIHGWSRGEEFVVLFARTNQGKSWILTRFMMSAWHSGFNVGFVSPEMSANKIGYRFDTLFGHFDNTGLLWGNNVGNYRGYLDNLKNSPAKFCVSTPDDFGGNVTVQKLKTFVKNNNIEILGIDGISYIQDERKTRNDNKQAELTHISEDLFQLSKQLGIPVFVVVQANRDGVKQNGGNLELENIRDADGISYNASKVIAIRQRVDEETIELIIKKNRDGRVGDKFLYQWIPNVGRFEYIPAEDDGNNDEDREERIVELKESFKRTDKSLPF